MQEPTDSKSDLISFCFVDGSKAPSGDCNEKHAHCTVRLNVYPSGTGAIKRVNQARLTVDLMVLL